MVYYVRTDVAPGIKQPADILKAQGLDPNLGLALWNWTAKREKS